MQIEGLDYNTQREQLMLPQYGREIQSMVSYAVSLPTKEERQLCAETIVDIMARMGQQGKNNTHNDDYMQKLWDHIALMSGFQLDIDYPCDVSQAAKISTKPEPMEYPMTKIPVRHYGNLLFRIFDKLKTMPEGKERDMLVKMTANQMRRNIMQWGTGSNFEEKVASDLAKYTDGAIQIDLQSFRFEKVDAKEKSSNNQRKKRK
ncbi:MAG: DUF4290 domain-containing protein [Prevotella sp.]|jgi:hypothetical protein|nr:DUF4290 domain-containing protein [Prevotella sp.]MCR5152657.1 DUF4290 domain-containing protein [Prevotella sp.]